jgi:hypothetical protein
VLALLKRELGDQAAAALAAALALQGDAGDQAQAIEMDATRDEGSTLN